MAVSTSEITITYAGVTVGGSSARQITEYVIDEHDFVNGRVEFEFVTTVASDAALKTEIDALRDAFRTPRGDLVIAQNTGGGAVNILSRKHSDNTGLNTAPRILTDEDAANTGRSRHFRIRVDYELPADVTSTSFRRGATVSVSYSPARRRTVTISFEYTANSTDGTTTADAQYLAQVASAETTLLNTVSSTATWERIGQPQIEYFETRKVVRATRVYKEVNINQSSAGADDTDIIDPHLEILVERMAPGDSLEGAFTVQAGAGGGGAGATSGPGSTTSSDPSSPAAQGGATSTTRPVLVTAIYEADINFETVTSTALLQSKWSNTIRPWMISQAQQGLISLGALVIVDEQPAVEIYEHHVRATMRFIAYQATIIKRKLSYRDATSDGMQFIPLTNKDPFAFYEFQGPAVRLMTVEEELEEVTSKSALQYVLDLYRAPGGTSPNLGDKWRRVSREPQAHSFTQGLSGGTTVTIAYSKTVSVFQFRNVKSPQVANAGGVTGAALT